MILLLFNIQGVDIIDHTNGKCNALRFDMQKNKFLSMLMPSAICVNFSRHVDHCVSEAYTS
jgi:hypothetical protein